MTEEDLLSKIFGEMWKSSTGQEYVMHYCDLCECFSIKCNDKKCHGSSCNAGGCDKCGAAFDEFHKCNIHIQDYLNEEEKKTFQKINRIKKHMKESLFSGDREIDWKKLKEEGKMSRWEINEVFTKELSEE